MPSKRHEALRVFFGENPKLLLELLPCVGLPKVVGRVRVRMGDSNLTMPESQVRLADVVAIFEQKEESLFALIVEIQLSQDPDKKFTWIHYLATLHDTLRSFVCLYAVVPDLKDALWAAQPSKTFQPGTDFTPFVIGPSLVKKVASQKEAAQNITMAILSVLFYCNEAQSEHMVLAVLLALQDIDKKQRELYADLVFAALSEHTKKELEVLMHTEKPPFLSDTFNNWFYKGIAAGKAEGKAEGEAVGTAKGKATAILKILEKRGITANAEQQKQILACGDLAVLDSWLDRSFSIIEAKELFL
jgi:hypothetical protein